MPNQPAAGRRGHYVSSIPDPLWERAQAVAAKRGESVSAAIRRALEEYVDPPPQGDASHHLHEVGYRRLPSGN